MTSVIILCYNESKEHIAALINKIPNNMEVILVDNRPHYQEYEFIASRSFTVVNCYGNSGTYYGRLLGFKESSGDKLWFINGDDNIDNVSILDEIKPNSYWPSKYNKELDLAPNWNTIWDRKVLEKAYAFFEGKEVPEYYCEDYTLFYYSKYIAKDNWIKDEKIKNIYTFNDNHWYWNVTKIVDTDKKYQSLNALKKLGENFTPLYNIQVRALENDPYTYKFKHSYKYDIAITMPIYKIGRERIVEYIDEIKQLFKQCSYQIVLSDNRPKEKRDCDLSEFDDEVVSHVDNGGNVYAFKARMNAFYKTDAYYIWSIDDDNYVRPEGSDLIRIWLANNQGQPIVDEIGGGFSIGVCWIPSDSLKPFYDKIRTEELPVPITYFEDALPLLFTTKKEECWKIDINRVYAPNTESWSGIYGNKRNVRINELESAITSFKAIFGEDSEHIARSVSTMLNYFNFSDEDYWRLVEILPDSAMKKLNIEKLNTIKFCMSKM